MVEQKIEDNFVSIYKNAKLCEIEQIILNRITKFKADLSYEPDKSCAYERYQMERGHKHTILIPTPLFMTNRKI